MAPAYGQAMPLLRKKIPSSASGATVIAARGRLPDAALRRRRESFIDAI